MPVAVAFVERCDVLILFICMYQAVWGSLTRVTHARVFSAMDSVSNLPPTGCGHSIVLHSVNSTHGPNDEEHNS